MGPDDNFIKHIHADWEVLKVILYHLVKNAIKHGSKGSEIMIYIDVDDHKGRKLIAVNVTNVCDRVQIQDWERNMQPRFAFSNTAENDNQ